MLNSDHPADERLSELASGDADPATEASLTDHLAACARCADLVADLRALRSSLAELPDLRPSRPLRLLPEVTAEGWSAERIAGWARRLFAPVLTAGAAMAMVGLVGTAAPALDPTASTFRPGEAQSDERLEEAADAGAGEGDGAAGEEAAAPPPPGMATDSAAGGDAQAFSVDESQRDSDPQPESERPSELPAERSPWPMVLFTGVAVMVAAALLRWILVPRAG